MAYTISQADSYKQSVHDAISKVSNDRFSNHDLVGRLNEFKDAINGNISETSSTLSDYVSKVTSALKEINDSVQQLKSVTMSYHLKTGPAEIIDTRDHS